MTLEERVAALESAALIKVQNMIVTDDKGRVIEDSITDETTGQVIRDKNKGTIVPVSIPSSGNGSATTDYYSFYAMEVVNAGDAGTTNGNGGTYPDPYPVAIVMPLGGTESGLFRFPKVGERVLVSNNLSSYYLMGYLPGIADQPFNVRLKDGAGSPVAGTEDTTGIREDQGEVFRYKKTGSNNSGTDEYSEIGFYNKKTAWKPRDTDAANRLATAKAVAAATMAAADATTAAAKAAAIILGEDDLGVTHANDAAGNADTAAANAANATAATAVTDAENAATAANDAAANAEAVAAAAKTAAAAVPDTPVDAKTAANEAAATAAREAAFARDAAADAKVAAVNADYPKIDQINIQSTGDIHSNAENHHRVKAKRFEMFVNCGEFDHSDDTGKKHHHPFLDQEGDDSELYEGDAHIRAKNRIIIKAGEAIVLQVGRSSITIDDSGILIASRKTRSNISAGWDTTALFSAKNGISMFGQHLAFDAGFDFKLAEAYGSAITGKVGLTRLSGFDINTSTINGLNYLIRGGGAAVDFVQNTALMASGIGDDAGNDNTFADTPFLKFTGYGSTLIRAAVPFLASKGNTAESTDFDIIDTMGTVMDIAILILTVVGIAIEAGIPSEILRDKKEARDGLYLALAVAEYGVLLASFVKIANGTMPCALFSTGHHLTALGDIDEFANNYEGRYVKHESGESPFAAIDGKTKWDVYKDGWNKFLEPIFGKGEDLAAL